MTWTRPPAHSKEAASGRARPLLVSFVLLAMCLLACGSTRHERRSAPAGTQGAPGARVATTTGANAALARHGAATDRDNDDAERLLSDDNNSAVAEFGHPASAADEHAVTALLRSYYATALAGNGVMACSMILSSLVKAVPADYGRYGPVYLRGGKTCPAVISRLFAHEHRRLIGETPRLSVLALHVRGADGVVLLGFGRLPERQISVHREAGTWKLGDLLDGELP